jgi:hypothetical protein
MDVQALTTLSRIEQTAPPPPIRRRFQLQAEPLVFAAVLLVLTLGLAHALPQAEAPADASNSSPTVIVVHAGRS